MFELEETKTRIDRKTKKKLETLATRLEHVVVDARYEGVEYDDDEASS